MYTHPFKEAIGELMASKGYQCKRIPLVVALLRERNKK